MHIVTVGIVKKRHTEEKGDERIMNLGLNLYSVRNLIKTEEDLTKTTAALREMGYGYLQFSGAPFDAEMIKRVSEKTGMPFVLTHSPIDRIIDDTERLIDEHASFGCKNIGLSTIPWSLIHVEDQVKKTIEKLEAAGEKMAKNGFSLYYHNHHVDFQKFGGQTILDYFAENAPSVKFTLDIYWAQFGGEDVMSLIEKLSGKIGCVHIKDYVITFKDGKFEPLSTAIGDGNFDFPKIIAAMKKSGTEYFLVEEENAADFPETLAEVRRNVEFAKAHLPMLL